MLGNTARLVGCSSPPRSLDSTQRRAGRAIGWLPLTVGCSRLVMLGTTARLVGCSSSPRSSTSSRLRAARVTGSSPATAGSSLTGTPPTTGQQRAQEPTSSDSSRRRAMVATGWLTTVAPLMGLVTVSVAPASQAPALLLLRLPDRRSSYHRLRLLHRLLRQHRRSLSTSVRQGPPRWRASCSTPVVLTTRPVAGAGSRRRRTSPPIVAIRSLSAT